MDKRKPQVGDFVECLFPFNEKPEQPAPSPHIAYLLAFVGDAAVVAIYTTTTMRPPDEPKSPYKIEINEAASQSMGMKKPFTINTAHTAMLPINKDFFPSADGGKLNIIGSADDRLRKAIASRVKAAVSGNDLRMLGPRTLRPKFFPPFG